ESNAADAREPEIVRRAQRQQGAGQTPAPFVEHLDFLKPGLPLQRPYQQLTNPFAGDKKKLAEGGALFVAYNCADCHGAEGSGAMAPTVADGRWHFGGSPGEVFQSIYEGRPEGMPAWGGRIPDDQIWRLVTYVSSLGAGKDLATENFTGKTIKKMGH